MGVAVKICGLKDQLSLQAAVQGDAAFIGFVFYPRSPRYVDTSKAAMLAGHVPSQIKRVGLFVDPTDDELTAHLAAVPLDILQFHGDETPQRIEQIRNRSKKPVMKAIRLGSAADLAGIPAYAAVSNFLLFDAAAGAGFGGTGQRFDWSLLVGQKIGKPWLLAGGLNVGNLAEAVRITGAAAVDVSSGVEGAVGIKDPAKIRDFLALAHSL